MIIKHGIDLDSDWQLGMFLTQSAQPFSELSTIFLNFRIFYYGFSIIDAAPSYLPLLLRNITEVYNNVAATPDLPASF